MKYFIPTLCLLPFALLANPIERVSLNASRSEIKQPSDYQALSANGRFVLISTNASLVPEDTNDLQDVYCYDRKTGKLDRVSVGPNGEQTVVYTNAVDISDDGRYVLMSSDSPALVPGGGNGISQVLLKDRLTGGIELISKKQSGAPVDQEFAAYPNAMTPDARFIFFTSADSEIVDGDTNAPVEGEPFVVGRNGQDGFVYDRQTQVMERVTVGTGGVELDRASQEGDISNDGRYVAFRCYATNAATVVGGLEGKEGQVYVRDRVADTLTIVSIGTDGAAANNYSGWTHISGDGSTITFGSPASNLVAGDTNLPTDGQVYKGTDIFVVSRTQAGTAGSLSRISIDAGGAEGNGGSYEPEISRDGRFIVFFSDATNLVTPDANGTVSDVYFVDRQKNTIERINNSADGTQGNLQATNCTVSASGQIILFHAEATNLVPNDTNGIAGHTFLGQDVFVVQRQLPPPAAQDVVDTDNDGLDDDWEIQYFGNLRYLDTDDADGDGLDNAAEFAAETNPFGVDLTLKRGWNVVSLPHALNHRRYDEFFAPKVQAAWVWDSRRQRDTTAFALPADQGIWILDTPPGIAQRTVPIALP